MKLEVLMVRVIAMLYSLLSNILPSEDAISNEDQWIRQMC
jgi:hypothetical protein